MDFDILLRTVEHSGQVKGQNRMLQKERTSAMVKMSMQEEWRYSLENIKKLLHNSVYGLLCLILEQMFEAETMTQKMG
ncbi:hypothetical protein V6N12_005701 [Hibiscus sabdariffa]|uniref:Uncharacterized protein n=1 Tax=Hibiscus sabdariffa TaxID=183260 RepID=A0ABR1ZQJ1_9ROSI